MMGKTEIFKLQRSLETNAPTDQVLIYNEDRSIVGELDLTEDIFQLFPKEPIEGIGLPHKIFVRGMVNEQTKEIDISEVAGWQDW